MSKKRKWSTSSDKAFKIQHDRKRVAILIPAQDMCNTGFAMCLAHMVQKTLLQPPENLEALTINSFGVSILPFGRQVLAKTALEQGVTHMLWIDSDMEFPSDMLLRFLKRDEPIIGINAMNRRKPFRNTALVKPEEPLVTTPDSSGLEKVYRMGFGVVWMAVEVIERMELPWFEFQWVPEVSLFMGEDYSFFEKAKALGYELYVDHDISKAVYHLGTFAYNPQMIPVAEELKASHSEASSAEGRV
jgi:hypothetical protein